MVLTLVLIYQTVDNRRIERLVAAQQATLNESQIAQRVMVNLLQDMAVASVESPRIKALLAANGFTVTQNAQNGQPPASQSTP